MKYFYFLIFATNRKNKTKKSDVYLQIKTTTTRIKDPARIGFLDNPNSLLDIIQAKTLEF